MRVEMTKGRIRVAWWVGTGTKWGGAARVGSLVCGGAKQGLEVWDALCDS
jgi:hypothetical protein